MRNRSKQSGAVEWILIASIAVGVLAALANKFEGQQIQIDQQQQQIEQMKGETDAARR